MLPGENRLLEYYHEFSDKSVLLYDENDRSVHLYRGGTLTLVGTGLAFSANYHIYLPHFVVMDNGVNIESIITSNGRIVRFTGNTERLIYAGRDYLVVGDGAANEFVYIVKRDGSVTVLDWDDNATGIQSP